MVNNTNTCPEPIYKNTGFWVSIVFLIILTVGHILYTLHLEKEIKTCSRLYSKLYKKHTNNNIDYRTVADEERRNAQNGNYSALNSFTTVPQKED